MMLAVPWTAAGPGALVVARAGAEQAAASAPLSTTAPNARAILCMRVSFVVFVFGEHAGTLGVAAAEQQCTEAEHDDRVAGEHRELAPRGEHVRVQQLAL